MLYYSLNNIAPKANFKEATLQGQAPDKGLYFPDAIPQLSDNFKRDLKSLSKEAIGFTVMQPYVADVMPDKVLHDIVAETLSFDIPLVPVTDEIFSLELFHGPTLAFKDVGARFMSRCLGYFLQNNTKKVTVLVATSGDTGGAVASGFYGVDGVQVVILYPKGKVSPVQELQLTTLGGNITALEVEGNFDDCQALVKKAFSDKELNSQLFLTSANSINVARWLPQQVYYFLAYQQWREKEAPVVCVPSGNFGNICAGILAYQSGLPVQHFIAACNANNTVPKYLQTECYSAQPAVATLSNAMDVGNPSNFVRVLELYQHQIGPLKNILSSYSISDAETTETLQKVFKKMGYLMDPHGAVAYTALERHLKSLPGAKGYFIETAHPVKFSEAVENIIGENIELPEAVQTLLQKKKEAVTMQNNFDDLKTFLLQQS